jgi:gag-polyprotein putative aspartyl protease
MNRMLSAAFVLATLASVGSAHATYVCNAPTQIIGATGSNPVVSTRIGIDNRTQAWFVVHTLRDGTQIHREQQYAMTTLTGQWFGWSGALNRNPSLWMAGYGSGFTANAETLTYNEELHDSSKNNVVIMKSYTLCYAQHDNAPQYVAPAPQSAPAPQYVAPAPQTPYVAAPQHANLTTVPLTTPDNWFSQFTTISVNNKWVKVQVDTGAYGMTMTQSLADAMVNNGDAARGGDSEVGGFDGAKQTVHHIVIKTLTFGGRDIADVDAVVVPDSGNPLLGMDILRRFGKFTIDTAASQLILG